MQWFRNKSVTFFYHDQSMAKMVKENLSELNAILSCLFLYACLPQLSRSNIVFFFFLRILKVENKSQSGK